MTELQLGGVGACLAEAATGGALILSGPGARSLLPAGVPVRHLPPATLIPVAEGARLANPSRPVVALGGDADVFGTGLGDLLHAVRRNTGVTCVVLDNGSAGGGVPTEGPAEYPLNPTDLARAAGATFVAAEPPGPRLAGRMAEALAHPGFALLHVPDRSRTDRLMEQQRHRDAYEMSVLGVAPLITTICTIDPDSWEAILFGEFAAPDDGEQEGTDANGPSSDGDRA